jgi:hypothetical protein
MKTTKKPQAAKKDHKRGPFKKLTITIGYYAKPDGSDVGTRIRGRVLHELFQEGGPAWQNIKGAVHDLIAEMGPLGPGRYVTIKSTP